MTNRAYGRRHCNGHMLDIDDTIRDGRFLDTPDMRGDGNMYYSSSVSVRYHGHHHYHPFRRSDRGYLLDEFNKEKEPIFDGEMKKKQDAEAWLLGMNNFFRIHDYSENMNARIATFSLKGKEIS